MPVTGRNVQQSKVQSLRWLLFAATLLIHAQSAAQTSVDNDKFLTLWAGSLPIILAAPHGGREAVPGVAPRRGVGVAQFTAERDSNTAELAEMLAVKVRERLGATPFLVVARFERKFIDANRPAAAAYESPQAQPFYDGYHRAMGDAAAAIRLKWGSGLLLDIHAQGTLAEAIYRGTDNGKSVVQLNKRFGATAVSGPKSVLGHLASIGYKILPDLAGKDRETRYTGGYTTRTYGSHRGTKIDAIQLELGSDLRAKANLERTANDFAVAVSVFAREYLLRGDGFDLPR
ncbi:MAG: N-formylglutamate amidohydrolase [Candidatus Binatia bacterium]